MKVFISHSNHDIVIAKTLIDLIRSSINLSADQIRCTSVNGYRLPIGENTEETLKAEVFDSEVLVGIITPSSMNSHYVLFELGARWGKSLPIYPIICSESGFKLLSGPLRGINALDGTDDAQLMQFVQDLAKKLKMTCEDPSVFLELIADLGKQCRESSEVNTTVTDNLAGEIEYLQKVIITLRGDEYTLKEIFIAGSGDFGIGVFRDDFRSTLFKLTNKQSEHSSEECSEVISELMAIDLVKEKKMEGTLYLKYYITETGKKVLKQLKLKA